MNIRKLPTLLINQIAAGEVIERPASVVKELVENSLDAGATRVEIAVEEGGHRLIRVVDDGAGIAPPELHLAVARHATSKLRTVEQLAAITTLGFRGEALASIASVSRMRLRSRPRGADAAAELEAAGDAHGEPAPASGAPGTTIEIRDLFFNTPARRKFRRTSATEFGHIHDAVTRIAMVHHGVAFRLTNNGRAIFDLAATPRRARRCVALIGKDVEEALLEFEQNEKVAGGRDPAAEAGRGPGAEGPRHPETRAGTRGSAAGFEDAGSGIRRPISIDQQQASSEEPGPRTPAATGIWGLAGLPSIARGSNRQVYLYVNDRPVKNRNLVHAVKEAYRGLIPQDRHPVAVVMIRTDPADVDVNVHPAKAEVRFGDPARIHALVLTAVRRRLLAADLTPAADLAGGSGPAARSTAINAESTAAFLDHFRHMDTTQKGFVYEQVRQAVAADDAAARDESLIEARPNFKPQPLLQIRNSYIVTEDPDGLLIVDQHALHERVMFESLRHRVLEQGGNLESQRLLMPQVVEATASQIALLDAMRPLLARLGMEAEPFGADRIALHALPSFLVSRRVDAVALFRELLDRVEDGQVRTTDPAAEEAALHDVLDMMACKAAVKAGDAMSPEELTELLRQRERIERSSNCPHGRPTSLRLTIRDLEKQFGRT